MIDKLRAFPALVKMIPPEDRGDPRALRDWLTLAAEYDRKGSDRPAYSKAFAELTAASAERDLRDKIAAAYWDPEIRARFGAARVEEAFRDPATAKAELLELSAAGRLPKEVEGAYSLFYEVEQFAADNGLDMPQPAAKPLPTGATAIAQAIADLDSKMRAPGITTSEYNRLYAEQLALYEKQVEGQGAAAERSPAKSSAKSEEDRLLDKSAFGTLSASEQGRLTNLINERLIAAGTISRADAEASAAAERPAAASSQTPTPLPGNDADFNEGVNE